MKRVLVVDDDRRMRRTLQILVERMGLESVAAADASEARAQLARRRFDLVLTDLKMPETSGIDLLEEIRAEQPAAAGDSDHRLRHHRRPRSRRCARARRTSSSSPSTTRTSSA